MSRFAVHSGYPKTQTEGVMGSLMDWEEPTATEPTATEPTATEPTATAPTLNTNTHYKACMIIGEYYLRMTNEVLQKYLILRDNAGAKTILKTKAILNKSERFT